MCKKSKLSNWLPTAIRQAVADMHETMRNPKYKIDMGQWWDPSQCEVCLAGCVMASRFEQIDFKPAIAYVATDAEGKQVAIYSRTLSPHQHEQYRIFAALDSVRRGLMYGAINFAFKFSAYPLNSDYMRLMNAASGHIPFVDMLRMADEIETLMLSRGFARSEYDTEPEDVVITDEMLREL